MTSLSRSPSRRSGGGIVPRALYGCRKGRPKNRLRTRRHGTRPPLDLASPRRPFRASSRPVQGLEEILLSCSRGTTRERRGGPERRSPWASSGYAGGCPESASSCIHGVHEERALYGHVAAS